MTARWSRRGPSTGEQAAYAVAGAGGFCGEVLVEAGQHRVLGGDLVGPFQRPQGVGRGAGGVRDVRGVLRVGFRRARAEVGDPLHREFGQVGDLAARIAGDGQRQRADGRGLVHDHQDGAELGLELVEAGPQFRFAVGHRLVEDLLPGRREPVTVMGALADVHPEEDAQVSNIARLQGC